MPPTIQDRAVKCLHEVPSFKATQVNQTDIKLGPGETLLGVYEPTGIGPTDIQVLFTDLGMHWHSDNKRYFVKYSQIQHMDSHNNKQEMSEQPALRDLVITLDSGQTVKLPVRGQFKHYLDWTNVWQFLNYVRSDNEREARKAAEKASKGGGS